MEILHVMYITVHERMYHCNSIYFSEFVQCRFSRNVKMCLIHWRITRYENTTYLWHPHVTSCACKNRLSFGSLMQIFILRFRDGNYTSASINTGFAPFLELS